MVGARTDKLLCLEAGRGIAALLVVLFHIDSYYFSTSKYWTAPLLGGLFSFGHAGVQYFFVLSGFVMIRAHFGDLGQPGKVASFARKRFIRIYPLVWVTVGASAIVFALVPTAGRAIYRDPWIILQSLALVGREPLLTINFPTWTLWHENLFYLFCAVIIARPQWGIAALCGWGLACLTTAILVGDDRVVFYGLRAVNILFVVGVSVAFALQRFRIPGAWLLLLGGTAGFFSFGVYTVGRAPMPYAEDAAYGLASAMIILGGIELERSGRLRLGGMAAALGRLSYPLYLSHMLVLQIATKGALAAHLTERLPPLAGAALLTAVAIAAAALLHLMVEQPATRRLRKAVDNGPHGRPVATA
jgi:peptidoglycan/LPS O-acetylase OafA/YrhL